MAYTSLSCLCTIVNNFCRGSNIKAILTSVLSACFLLEAPDSAGFVISLFDCETDAESAFFFLFFFTKAAFGSIPSPSSEDLQ